MKNIAIIPARSGSKGLKDKNIKLLNGKPLLAYTIEAAIKSKCFDTIYVSTDSKKYARIAEKYGAEVPFLRSKEASSDKASSWLAVEEALDKYKELNKEYDNLVLLQPTSPLRDSKDIKNAFKLFKEKKANMVVSVCESEQTPDNTYKIKDNLYFSDEINKNESSNKRRQDLDKYYVFNGAIYLIQTAYFIKNKDNVYKKGCYAYIMNKLNSIDIDDYIDFKIAETLLKNKRVSR